MAKIGKNWQKLSNILSKDLSFQADPARENWTWSYPYFSLKGRFSLVKNTTLAFSILTKFDIKFLENAWGFHRGVT